jgi:hypothetical protein
MRREDEPMAHQQTHARLSSGRFVKGQSGNPAGRSKGSTNHAADLRRLEKDAIKLATNVADTIAETARLVLNEIEQPELIPLFDAITCAAKEAVRGGEIGPSSVAVLRGWFDDHQEGDPEGDFFVHAGLPADCGWEAFKAHYMDRGRIDHGRHATDLSTYPPIVQRIKELRAEHLITPVVAKPLN